MQTHTIRTQTDGEIPQIEEESQKDSYKPCNLGSKWDKAKLEWKREQSFNWSNDTMETKKTNA